MSTTPVTLILLILNGLVGAYTLFYNRELVDRWSFKPYLVAQNKEWFRWLTAGFAHVGMAHLAFNMITLYFFGPYVETQLGPMRFLVVYFGAELAANGLTYLRYRNNPKYSAVGASGAVSGVVFAFCLFLPLAPIYLFLIPIGIPAIIFAVLYIGFSIYASNQGRGRIAHEAHIGGALGGLVLTILLYPRAISIFLSQLGMG